MNASGSVHGATPGLSRAPVLVIGVGNPSRGDDALGPAFVEAVAADTAAWPASVELLTDFQLQIEHALDCAGRELVVFVDATVEGPAPFTLRPVEPDAEASHTTHAMSPGAVLEVAARACGGAPPAWVLGIRGVAFELGAPLSPTAAANLRLALRELRHRVGEGEHEGEGEGAAAGRRPAAPHRLRESAFRSTGSNQSA